MAPVLHDYEVSGVLLRQSTGIVHAGRFRKSGYSVSVEEIASDLRTTPGFVARLAEAGKRAAVLKHPRAVTVYNLIDEGGSLCLITDLVAGTPLGAVAPRGVPMTPSNALAVVDDVISAVEEAHRLGVVHGDIRPEVITIGRDGKAKLGGFAVAYALATTPSAPAWRRPTYAPHRAPGSGADESDDLYACAALAHDLMTGSPPGESTVALPDAIRQVLERAMSSMPRERYLSATGLRSALTGAAAATLGSDWRTDGDLADRAGRGAQSAEPTPTSTAATSPTPTEVDDVDPTVGGDALEPAAALDVEPTTAAALDDEPETVEAPPLDEAAGEVEAFDDSEPISEAPGPIPATATPQRGRRIALTIVFAIGVAAVVALILSNRSSSPSARPLHLNNDVRLVATPQVGGCTTGTFHFVASGTFTGAGTLTYQFVQSDGRLTPPQDVTITPNQGSFQFTAEWKFQGSQDFTGTMTFRVLTPDQRSATQTITYHCA